tara:strand:- start:119 stop:454 length:336 start_codon:yes stop_codon:yes gene_type:complete
MPKNKIIIFSNKKKYTSQICFNKKELNLIMKIYSRHVIAGDWYDYALDISSNKAVFSIFGQRGHVPAYRIVKQKNGLRRYRLIEPGGRIVSMDRELKQVLGAIENYPVEFR